MKRHWSFAANRHVVCCGSLRCRLAAAEPAALQVGTSAVNLTADDAMVIAGGIGPGKAQGQEGELRATAVVLAQGTDQSGDRQLRCADADARSAGPGRRGNRKHAAASPRPRS